MKIFLIGFMGCGKTTVGKKLAHQLGFNFLDLDEYIERSHGKSISEIIETGGEEKFRALESACLKEIVASDNTVIATGGGTPCFNNNMELINNKGISVYLKMSVDGLANRLGNAKTMRPLIKGLSEDELKNYILNKLTEREIFYLQAHYKVKAKNLNVGELAEFVMVKPVH